MNREEIANKVNVLFEHVNREMPEKAPANFKPEGILVFVFGKDSTNINQTGTLALGRINIVEILEFIVKHDHHTTLTSNLELPKYID